MVRRRSSGALTYRGILILAATGILLLDIILAALIFSKLISPSYSRTIHQRLQDAYTQVAQDPTGDMQAIEAQNIHVLVVDQRGNVVYCSLDVQQTQVQMLLQTVDESQTLPVFQNSGSQTEGQLFLMGRARGYYIGVNIQLDPVYALMRGFARYTLALGLILWLVTFLFVVLIERRLFHPINEAIQIADRIAHQDFSQQCGSGGIARESQELARSINEMSVQMQAALRELRQANEQLTQDINAVARSENAMKNLVSNLSHDLKTPVALISGYAEGLAAGMAKTPEQSQEYCAIIMDEAERMHQIISRMLQLTQLESGKVTLELETFNVSQMLDRILNQFQMAIQKEQIHLHRLYAPELPICTDYVAAEQVLTNLIQNAVYHCADPRYVWVQAVESSEATPLLDDEPIVPEDSERRLSSLYRPARWVGAAWSYLRRRSTGSAAEEGTPPPPSQSDDAPQRLRIEIYNSSPPIPPEQMAHLWDRFYRGEQSRKRSRGEMGLGLAIVRSNMELLDLPYGVRNTAHGVVFWAEFPLAIQPPSAPAAPPTTE